MVDKEKGGELKKGFIIDEDVFPEQHLTKFIERIKKVCHLNEEGKPNFMEEGLDENDQIIYYLVARFLANKIDADISKTVKSADFEEMLGKAKSTIKTKMSKLKKENLVKIIGKDGYEIKPFYIEKVISTIPGDDSEEENQHEPQGEESADASNYGAAPEGETTNEEVSAEAAPEEKQE